jgi:hypothetical protein
MACFVVDIHKTILRVNPNGIQLGSNSLLCQLVT